MRLGHRISIGNRPLMPIKGPIKGTAGPCAGPLKKDLRGPERFVPSVGHDPQSPVAAIYTPLFCRPWMEKCHL